MDDVSAPLFYVVSRSLTAEQTAIVLHALKITPASYAIVTDIHDVEFGRQFAPEVIRTNTLEDAHAMAAEIAGTTGQPSVVIGDAMFFESHYADGRKEMHES